MKTRSQSWSYGHLRGSSCSRSLPFLLTVLPNRLACALYRILNAIVTSYDTRLDLQAFDYSLV